MNARTPDDDGRTGRESSPSCGTFETAEEMHAPNAHAVEDPADLEDNTMYRDTSPMSEVVQ